MSQREDTLKFETGRIKALQEERLHIQKKTFTKWMNSFLAKARMEVDDLFLDLADGKKLLKLLEIISGEKLGKPNNGKMRVHKIENVNKSLAFLHTKVRLESIGAEDIVDGNPRLILGLIWTIILRFQIQEIEIDVDEENESSEKKSAKDALLLWCQRKTAGYNGVNIQDFTGSWRSGLGFNALIHSHRPDLINYEALDPYHHIDNLNNAFDIAQRELGIAKLLDAEDVDTNKPDEKSVITYVASYYHTFAKMKNEMKGGRRIANIVGQMMDADQQKDTYQRFSTNLLDWINMKIKSLEDRNFPNSLDGIQGELTKFKLYRTEEKPKKYKEKSEIEAMLFSIQTKLKALGQPLFVPPEGLLVHDIERAWEELEKAEHSREVALRDELLRQERLEQLAYKFERKSVLREGYLQEMIQVLSDPRYGSNLSQVEATVKKHEAISADILAREERFHDLNNMALELVKENYHDKDAIVTKKEKIMDKWKSLLELLDKHKQTLTAHNNLMNMLRDVDTMSSQIKTMEESFSSEDYGKHLLAVEDLLQKHNLLESQIVILGETMNRVSQQAEHFIATGHKESPVLSKRLQNLKAQFANLTQLSAKRREKLEESRVFLQFIQDYEEEESWIIEKQRVCQTVITGKDLRAVLSLQRKHKALEDEVKIRWPKSEQLCKLGELLIQQYHPEAPEIKSRIINLNSHWKDLHNLMALRKTQLDDCEEACQYYTDANEADSWMNEKITLVTSKDYGDDEPTAQSLLQRHGHLESEIKSYEGDIQRLNEQAEKLISSGNSSLNMIDQFPLLSNEEPEEYIEEVVYIPEEVEVEQIVDKEVMKEVTEEKRVPQVRANYSFQGQGMEMNKGEIMILLSKTNNDWWNVRKANGQDGFIPANYVKEVEPKIVRRNVKRPVKVPETQRVKKIVKKPQIIKKKKEKILQNSSKRSSPLRNSQSSENDTVERRQQSINNTYEKLLDLTKARRSYLEDAIELFGFYRECDDFEAWMKDKEKMLTNNDKTESVENLKRKFENFLTDLSASTCRIEAIDKKVKDFIENGHSKIDAVKFRQKQIHDRWNKLNRLKNLTEKNLEGATSVELFNRTCDEANDWMLEKLDKMDTDELGKDLKTIQSLQRKHQNLERELAPVEEKFNRVNLLAQSVKSSYPNERTNVTGRQKNLHDLWNKVKDKAAERRSRLEEAVGQQIFNNTAKNLFAWIENVKQALKDKEAARDVATAEALMKKHQELKDDINAHQDEFEDLYKLGGAIMHNNPEAKMIQTKLQQLQEEEKNIHKGWEDKEKWLEQCIKFQMFNREADHIDAITGNHEKFLENTDLGSSLDDLEALMKRHDDFENTFAAQEERIKNFSNTADKLIAAHHYESPYINQRRAQVLDRRQNVKDKALKRKNLLLESQAYHKFKADAEELASWIQDKHKTASDESYKDLTNLQRKLQKHEAFEGELKANEGRLRANNRFSQQLIADNHFKSPEVKAIVSDVTQQWKGLCLQAEDKGKKLRQAVALQTYYKTLEDVKGKLTDIENDLASDDLGSDLRHVKYLLKKHQALENDMNMWNSKITELVTFGDDMVDDGHFDAANIQKQTQALKNRYLGLKDPVSIRRQQLEESLKLHQFNFEVDIEMQWIKEHLPIACSTDIGDNLVEAQNLVKKHKKFEIELTGHQQVIEKTLGKGQLLIKENHYASDSVRSKCSELENAWQNLCSLAEARKKKLELSLKAQLFYSEASEIEGWMNEKNDILDSQDYGRDEDAAVKLLTKHKALELELDSYNGLINEMGHRAQQMIDGNHPDSKIIQNKQHLIAQQIKTLLKLANVRRQKLMESKHMHEYFRESNELEQWIGEQFQAASSDEFGQDYEHLLILLNKFDDFKHRVEASSDQFVQCEELAKKLIANDSPYTSDIEKRQQQLQISWNSLMEQMETREQKLQAAGEIHRFNRDVAEALQRIQEKYSSIPDDVGRDLNSVLSLMRRHEGFENDLVALEAQLQVLIDDSARLQDSYPGGNAEHILMQQTIVLEQWDALQEYAVNRKKKLQASCDLQRFLASVRDLVSWANSLQTSIMTEETVRDATSAQILKIEHDRLKAEIEAREESFSAVVQTGEFMIENNHYAKNEIEDKIKLLLDTRQKLHAAWQHKKIYLDQLIDLQFFLRDAKQQETVGSTQEAYLSGSDYGTTVEEVTLQLKKHDAFEKLMQSQDEKLSTLQNHCSKLVQQSHFDAPNIKRRMSEVLARRSRIKELSSNRKQKLSNTLLYTQFKRDIAEADAWIEDKRKKLEMENQAGDALSLEDKIKRLQKHQAFEAELAAREISIKEIKKKGDMLLSKHYEAIPSIREQMDNLLARWNQLLLDSNNRSRGLEEAQDILQFSNQVEKVEAWIRDKEMMIQAGDMGKDYEHCLAIQRRLEDVDSDMQVDESRIKKISAIADKLIRQGRSDTRTVQQRKEEVNNKWRALQGALQEYKDRLSGALEVHAFNRDVNDTNDRINEKAIIMSAEDYGKDLSAVEALQRKQEAIERDMTAIEGKLREHDGEARRLIPKYPDMATPIRMKLTEVQDNWRSLNNLCHTRKQLLASSFTLQKFLAEMKELETWVNEMISRMTSGQVANDISEAEMLMQLHQERKAEIDGRQDSFKGLKEFGRRLIQQNHYAKEDLEKYLTHLEEQRRTLLQVWEEQKQILKQSQEYQLFNTQADQADDWLNSKEAFLNNEDLGDSLASVETLMRKHEAFEKTLEAQENKIDQLEKFATELMASKHNDSIKIQDRLQAICQRRDRLKENTVIRHRKLQDSKQLQQFLRNNYEVLCWISEKLKVACDENYRDPTNLQRKIQKHLAFEAELGANKGRVNAVNKEGESLIGSGHFAAMEIQAELDELESKWQDLQDESQLKKERLNDAYQAMLLNQSLEDLDSWMDDVETQLQSEDHGKDLASVQHLLKKHQNLETDINNHADNIEHMKNNATSFANSNHFMSEEIQEKVQAIVKRYSSLHEPVQIRRDNLEEAQLLYQFYRDADDELMWIGEKEPLVMSADLGLNLTAVQNLQKKHQALEAEIKSHDPVITSVASMAQQMIRNNHFASANIESKIQELHRRLQQLKDQASVRRLRLLDAVESQMFYSEVSEADVWIKEKLPLLNNPDIGKDEESVQILLKKLNGIERDVETFNTTVVKLHQLHQRLVERGHFDSQNIKQKQSEIEEKFQELQSMIEKRYLVLNNSKQLFKYIREADELVEWMDEQMTIANAEEYGRDLEHIEIVINKFDGFLNNLNVSEERVKAVVNFGTNLINDGNHSSVVIQQKNREVLQAWEDLKEQARMRQEALHGAKLVHLFDRNADETIGWIHEKDAVLTSEDYGHDLESIQSLVRKHEGFERDLAAIKEKVENIVSEARNLANQFPDASDHISIRHEETVEVWNSLLDKSAQRKDKLHQAEQLQAYFDEYRELMAWISEMMAKITAPELSQDVSGAEALLARHNEHRAEIDTHKDAFSQFNSTGQHLISRGHFMGDEIQDKINRLNASHKGLLLTWKQREELYKQNLDVQIFKLDADNLEKWLDSREPVLRNEHMGDSISNVEELIRKHEDFEKTIEAQEEKFNALRRITLLEEAFQNQKKLEFQQRKVEEEKREQERVDAIKRKEQQRILDERRREGERRRTTEIKFINKDNELVLPVNLNGDFKNRSPSTERLQRYPSSDSVSSSPGLLMRKMSAVEIPDIKPSEDLMKIGGSKVSLDTPDKGNLRRGESMRIDINSKKPELSSSSIKRSESMKLDEQQKKLKKTPSFTTRRRTHSFRKNKRGPEDVSNLPPVEAEGYLDRKQELQSGGKRAAIRSWKTYYTVLCGQLLCFFRDKDDFIENKAAAPPVNIHQAKCSKASDYTKKKYVFRIQLTDGAEYLLSADLSDTMTEWINKIIFHATLPPRMQLLRYDAAHKDGEPLYSPTVTSDSPERRASLSQPPVDDPKPVNLSEHKQADLVEGKPVVLDNHNENSSPNSSQPIYVNFPFNPDSVHVRDGMKPPVPARSVSLDTYNKDSPEDGLVKSRIQMFQNSQKNKVNSFGVQNENGFSPVKKSPKPQTTNPFEMDSDEPVWIARNSGKSRPSTGDDGMPRTDYEFTEGNSFLRKPHPQDNTNSIVGRHHSLPLYSAPPEKDFSHSHTGTMDTKVRMSLNDTPDGEFHSDKKNKEKKRGFPRFFKKS